MKDLLATIAMPAIVLALMALTAKGCAQEHRKREDRVNLMLHKAHVGRVLVERLNRCYDLPQY